MYKGKNKCKILKQIRAEIARNNGIDYVVEECKYKGDCTGTCPKCEAEVRMLEQKLAERASLGKRVLLAGVAAGIALTASACGPDPAPTAGTTEPRSSVSSTASTGTEEVVMGEEVPAPTEEVEVFIQGMMVAPGTEEQKTPTPVTMGDVPAGEEDDRQTPGEAGEESETTLSIDIMGDLVAPETSGD